MAPRTSSHGSSHLWLATSYGVTLTQLGQGGYPGPSGASGHTGPFMVEKQGRTAGVWTTGVQTTGVWTTACGPRGPCCWLRKGGGGLWPPEAGKTTPTAGVETEPSLYNPREQLECVRTHGARDTWNIQGGPPASRPAQAHTAHGWCVSGHICDDL